MIHGGAAPDPHSNHEIARSAPTRRSA